MRIWSGDGAKPMSLERFGLILVGAAIFVLGAWVHRDRESLAVTLVVIGVVVGVLGTLLPYVRNIQGEVAGVSLQLALVQLPPPLSAEPLGALRGDELPDSGSAAFAKLLRHPGATAYSIINLGDGRQWLTSRLLVFTVVLQELRGARCFVFTRENQFIGTVRPDDLRRCFSWRYPWLTAALAQAWEQIVAGQGGPDRSELTAQTADQLLQLTSHRLVQPNPPVPSVDTEWTTVRNRLEHARWVDEPTLADALDRHLNVRRLTAAQVSEVTAEEVLAVGGEFVALVNHDNQFVALLDRHALLTAEATKTPAR
jgi:hypothetical protein